MKFDDDHSCWPLLAQDAYIHNTQASEFDKGNIPPICVCLDKHTRHISEDFSSKADSPKLPLKRKKIFGAFQFMCTEIYGKYFLPGVVLFQSFLTFCKFPDKLWPTQLIFSIRLACV